MISVIIPTYLPGFYLRECLESIEKQTLPKQHFEVILVLNGERDPYFQSIEQLLEKYTFTAFLYYTEKKGVSNARNLGIERAEGEYCCFIDDDDIISSNYLEEFNKLAAKDVLVVSNLMTFEGSLDNVGKDYLSVAFLKDNSSSSIFSNRKFFSSSCAKLIPRELISNRRFDSAFELGEDALFMASISDKVTQIVKTRDDAVYYRRIRSESASRKKYNKYIILQNKLMLIKAYITIYLSNIQGYNLAFFLSRIVATVLRRYRFNL